MRRLMPSALALAATILFGYGPAVAMPQISTGADTGWTPAKPLKGRAIPCTQGKIQELECENVELLSFLPYDSLGRSVGTDLWGWHDSTTGREFLIVGGGYPNENNGRGEATAFVEVTDPLNPKYLGVLPPRPGVQTHGAQGVKVYRHYAFIGYEFPNVPNGLQVFDLTQLRGVTSPKEFQEAAHYDQFANAHTIALNPETGFAYANGTNTCSGGLHMIDVRTPTKPTFAGCYTEKKIVNSTGVGYIHDAQCVLYRGPDQQYRGREICVNYAGSGITIADVTDKQQPKTISMASYPTVGYTHQGWFTKDQRHIFLNDEGDECCTLRKTMGEDSVRTRTIGFDLSDLDDPVVVTEFYNSKTSYTDHNLYIQGRYMYQGNNSAGLRIIDVADPKNLKEVGYLKLGKPWGKAWGTYPFLRNDVVAVSSTAGLYLARLRKR